MIEFDGRFQEIDGAGYPGKEDTDFYFHFLDYDERRKLQVFGTIPTAEFDDQLYYEPRILAAVKAYAPRFTPETRKLRLGRDYTVEGEDGMPHGDFVDLPCTIYARLDQSPSCLRTLKTVSRSAMVESKRLGFQVDLCYYRISGTESRKVVFKYYLFRQAQEMLWGELDILSRLPPHPYIAPFDRLVLEGGDKFILGFTSVYVSGGNLEDHPRDQIKLKWLHQLIQVIDDLNLRLGIQHCDIHPRNVLVDEKEDKIQLIDFGFAARYGEDLCKRPSRHENRRSDSWGAAYTFFEIITRDYSLRDKTWEYPDVASLMNKQSWKPHQDVTLDHDVGVFHETLRTWLSKREARGFVKDYKDCPENLGAPSKIPDPPQYPVKKKKPPKWQEVDGLGRWHIEDSEEEYLATPFRESELSLVGLPIISWLRPAQDRLEPGRQYLATGEPLEGELPIVTDHDGPLDRLE